MPHAMDPPDSPSLETRAGYVTLAGRPNAGKSTLLNAMVGEKLSIVTPRAQTTWQRITGILTTESAQMIFLDTPGLLDPGNLFQRTMLGAALEALDEADTVLLVLDASRSLDEAEAEALHHALPKASVPIFAAINKIDISDESSIRARIRWAEEEASARAFPVSALRGEGVDALLEALESVLPPSPFFYPRDHLATASVRFFVAEMVRETVFERFRQEIPYGVFCTVEEFREGEDPVYIQVNAFVERKSQKGILIGKKGAAIRELGKAAREKIEAFLDRRVYLDLWVKVLPDWRRKKGQLERFGFRPPEEHEASPSS